MTAPHRPARTYTLTRTLQIGLSVGIGSDLVLLAVRVARYPAYFAMTGALTFLIEPLIPLCMYAVVIGFLPWLASRWAHGPSALRMGTLIGLLGGVIGLVSTTLENLASLPQAVVTVTSGVAMLCLFMLFALAGFLSCRRTGAFAGGLVAAMWSAMVTTVIVVTFGFLVANTSLPTLAHDEIGDPDYRNSGWTDVRAFAIANTFDAGFVHLWEAPIIAAVLGAAGSGIGRLGKRPRQADRYNLPFMEEGPTA